MSMFWEGFWFVLFTLSNVNGYFIILTTVISSPWQSTLATVASTAIFRWMLNGKRVLEPICIDIAAVTLHQFLVSSWGLKWTLMVVALGLNVLPFFTGYLALQPGRPLNIRWWLVLLFISVNLECVMMVLYSCSQRERREYIYCKLYRVIMGLLLIAHSLFFCCMHREFKRQRLLRIMTARIMNAQIKGLGSLIPIGWRHAQ